MSELASTPLDEAHAAISYEAFLNAMERVDAAAPVEVLRGACLEAVADVDWVDNRSYGIEALLASYNQKTYRPTPEKVNNYVRETVFDTAFDEAEVLIAHAQKTLRTASEPLSHEKTVAALKLSKHSLLRTVGTKDLVHKLVLQCLKTPHPVLYKIICGVVPPNLDALVLNDADHPTSVQWHSSIANVMRAERAAAKGCPAQHMVVPSKFGYTGSVLHFMWDTVVDRQYPV